MIAQGSRCGYVAVIGRPNVGKSTLINSILGAKVSITCAKPQTTRFQILGIKTCDQVQTIYMDTPGLHSNDKRAMNRYMNRLAVAVIPDADVIVWVIEALAWENDDDLVLRKLKDFSQRFLENFPPVIVVVNKVDLVADKNKLLPFLAKIKDKFDFTSMIPLSALNPVDLETLQQEIAQHLPLGPHFFPDEQITDKSLQFQVAEIVREKLMQATEQEVPYSTTVEIEEWKMEEKCLTIGVLIWVERDGQKQIVIGKKGANLKKIGMAARQDIEALLSQKVFLRLWVKVKAQWTDNDKALRQLGYK